MNRVANIVFQGPLRLVGMLRASPTQNSAPNERTHTTMETGKVEEEADEEEKKKGSWRERKYEFSKPVSAAWDGARVIPPAGWERMKKGLWPQQMEDRWVIAHVAAAEANGGEGEGIVLARSWTRYPLTQITVIPSGADGCSRRITKITWEGDEERWRVDDRKSEAKKLVVRFARGVFQVDLANDSESNED
ncbi:hypothetical protein K4K54_011914 [Colletotrichum sp. SAR 10_86]|nr:hypothetical protein KHU50_011237 [Colletotrichum sp. SAR 10_65]KAI8217181.1 hypothetical protein K4K54_011914 [Colletotrichum sp. SAR 10_86]KAI8249708.1 hypothetical protein K4K58_010504 [Colletotrichum sp. SAR11_239]